MAVDIYKDKKPKGPIEPKLSSQEIAKQQERLNKQWSDSHKPVIQSQKNKTGH